MTPSYVDGAWSLDGRPVETHLDESLRRALRAEPAPAGGFETRRGPLWLAASSGVERGGRVLAWEGFVPAAAALDPAGDPRRLRLDGPHVFVHADLDAGILTLGRDPSGADRLYFARRGGLLLFSSRLRRLSAALGGPRALDADAALERALSELPHFGDAALLSGAREILAGHRVEVRAGASTSSWHYDGLLEPLEGDVPTLAAELRRRLRDAVAACVEKAGAAAVSLSGGIDSSTMAALAVEVLGPDKVSAFTYEFEDAQHPSEAPFAAASCAALGIRDHEIVRVSRDAYMAGIPEAVWRAEEPAAWKRPFIPLLARHAARRGHPVVLTGCGIGSHMDFMANFARGLGRPPASGVLRGPDAAIPDDGDLLGRAERRLKITLLNAMRQEGRLESVAPFFPAPAGAMLDSPSARARARAAFDELAGLPLERRLQRLCFAHMNSAIDIVRDERLGRELSCPWASPAYFASCLRLAYFPPPSSEAEPKPQAGKTLLALAMAGRLPDSTLSRPKHWPHTVGPKSWRDAALERMRRASTRSLEALSPLVGGDVEPLLRYNPAALIPLAFWREIFVETAASREPPSWDALERA